MQFCASNGSKTFLAAKTLSYACQSIMAVSLQSCFITNNSPSCPEKAVYGSMPTHFLYLRPRSLVEGNEALNKTWISTDIIMRVYNDTGILKNDKKMTMFNEITDTMQLIQAESRINSMQVCIL